MTFRSDPLGSLSSQYEMTRCAMARSSDSAAKRSAACCASERACVNSSEGCSKPIAALSRAVAHCSHAELTRGLRELHQQRDRIGHLLLPHEWVHPLSQQRLASL